MKPIRIRMTKEKSKYSYMTVSMENREDFDRYRTRCWADISLDAILENAKRVRTRINPETGICAIVKCNAYGHGACAVSRCLEEEKSAEMLAVAQPEEALELRSCGVRLPILILGYCAPVFVPDLLDAGRVYLPAYSVEYAKMLSASAVEIGKEIACFLVVDTGMARIGVPSGEEGVRDACAIAAMPGLRIDGLFSHFARADSPDKSDALLAQSRFEHFAQMLAEAGIRIPCRSLYNSAAVVSDAFRTSYELARPGIVLYGAHDPAGAIPGSFLPALSWYARIVQIKTVAPGTGIGYDHTYVTERQMRIATVSAGYGDGYPRRLSGSGRVEIRGRLCPIVGRLCMDMMMVDLSPVPEAELFDEVLLLGGDGELSADRIAEAVGSLSHEVFCDISPRVPRLYLRNGETVGCSVSV